MCCLWVVHIVRTSEVPASGEVVRLALGHVITRHLHVWSCIHDCVDPIRTQGTVKVAKLRGVSGEPTIHGGINVAVVLLWHSLKHVSLSERTIDIHVKLMLVIDADDNIDPLVEREVRDDNLLIDSVEGVHDHHQFVRMRSDVQAGCVVRLIDTGWYGRRVDIIITLVEDVLVGVLAVGEVIHVDPH